MVSLAFCSSIGVDQKRVVIGCDLDQKRAAISCDLDWKLIGLALVVYLSV